MTDHGAPRCAQKHKQEFVEQIDSDGVRWFVETLPSGFFIAEYWLGLFSGLVLGILFHSTIFAIMTGGPIPI